MDLFGRVLVGKGAVNSTLAMAYSIHITTNENRIKSLVTQNGVNLVKIQIHKC